MYCCYEYILYCSPCIVFSFHLSGGWLLKVLSSPHFQKGYLYQMIAPFVHRLFACLMVLPFVAFAIGLLFEATSLLHKSSYSQELFSAAPLVGLSLSHVGLSAPLVRRTFSLVGATISLVSALIPRVRRTIPHVRPVIPRVKLTIPHVGRCISQVEAVCFRFSKRACKLVTIIFHLSIPKTKSNER